MSGDATLSAGVITLNTLILTLEFKILYLPIQYHLILGLIQVLHLLIHRLNSEQKQLIKVFYNYTMDQWP